MDGDAELLQLAHLLRVGAEAAREVATIRPNDSEAIDLLAEQAEVIADAVEAIVAGRRGNVTVPPLLAPQS